ncbi:MAG: GDSL-type esterase/lipase family protein [Verrucomicrobiales bacterium]
MGDSITNGSGGTANRGGYRGTLYDLLVAAEYDIDFVGTTTTNSSLLADMDHEGHGGWRIDQLDSNVAAWLAAIDTPDIVLLHIGTNDFGQGVDTANAIHRLDALIGKIATLSPSSHVIVTNLMERGEPQNAAIQAEFNPFVEGVVADHLAAGHLVSFLDMRAAVPLSDMPDNLHPNQAGYDKMAAAWFAAIEDVIEPGDEVPPELRRARGSREGNQVIATFNKRVDEATATDPANYAVDGGIAVLAASLDALGRTVTLTTDPQTLGQTYTLTVNSVLDRVVPVPNEIAPDSQATFFPFTPRGFRHNVPESDCYTLVYSLDVPSSPNYQAAPPAYAVDNSRLIGSFDRIAYYLELQTATGDLRYAWASMDAFTSDPGLVGVPVLANGASFQQPVANLNIVSNAPGLSTGEAFAGNIEFWPTNYQGANSAGVPGASDADFDIGDNQSAGTYGSMQIHNTSDAETVIAFNRWGGTTGVADLGIGNNPTPVSGGIDWTFAQNAAGYSIKTLQVLVRAAGDFDPPALESARAGYGGNRIRVRFSEPVRAETVVAANFALDEGVEVLAATLGEDGREVLLETTFHPVGTPLTLTANGVRDTSPNANVIAAHSTIAVEPAALPAEVIANIGAAADGYELVYSLDIPAAGTFNNRNPYAIDDHGAPGLISRIAYYVELQQPGGEVQYLWAAMDAFTGDKGKIGIPTFASGAVFQQPVANLDVISNVAGVVNGTGMAGGNIEFWPTNYGRPNTGAVPGADDATFDFGDERSAGGTHGSMQIHNGGEGQTLFAMNNWGADGNPIALGIGNRPTADPDWTFAANAASYSRRVLHVMVLPAAPPPAPPEVLANVPEASDYELV